MITEISGVAGLIGMPVCMCVFWMRSLGLDDWPPGNQMPIEEYNKLRKLKLLRWTLGFVVVLAVSRSHGLAHTHTHTHTHTLSLSLFLSLSTHNHLLPRRSACIAVALPLLCRHLASS